MLTAGLRRQQKSRTQAATVAVIPTMPDRSAVSVPAAFSCPHEQAGLTPFDSLFPPSQNSQPDVTLPAGSKVLLTASANIGTLTIPAGAELIFSDVEDLTLTAAGIRVYGALRMGSSSCTLNSKGIRVVLSGSRYDFNDANREKHSKGIHVDAGGTLVMHGRRWAPTWTRLDGTATTGTATISLQQAVDWEVGQSVVVVTSAYSDDQRTGHQNEERRIVGVAADGLSITLDQPLLHAHYGGPEYATEVAMLSRSITVEGDAGSEDERYGGHVFCDRGSSCTFASIRGHRLGQEKIMGRYPFHFHMMGNVGPETYMEDCVVQHSYFRGFTLHGTNGARLSRNVAYDVTGSVYYLEDGAEERNTLEFNLAALVHIISPTFYGYGQVGVTLATTEDRLVPTDATAVGFYCTKRNNRWVGNSASGGFAGFHFPQVRRPLGLSALEADMSGYQPDAQELLEFNGNTAHSSGFYWTWSACIYIGGELWEGVPGSQNYSYITGRVQPARLSGRTLFNNTKVFACEKGITFWGAHWSAPEPQFMLEGAEFYDVARSSNMLSNTYMTRAVIVAHTDNPASDLPQYSEGFELYDTDTITVLSDVEFRNFDRPNDQAIIDMTHSNIYKQQGMFAMKDITFNNVNPSQCFRHRDEWKAWDTYHNDECSNKREECPGTTGSSQMSTLIDIDGSAQGSEWQYGAAIMGADDTAAETDGKTNEWWLLDSNCSHRADWGFYVCPTYGRREVVTLWMVVGLEDQQSSTMLNRWGPAALRGTLYQFGREERKIEVGLAGSPMISGPCCDIGWYYRPQGDVAVRDFTIWLDQMVAGPEGLIFAASYPQGAAFTIQKCNYDGCSALGQSGTLDNLFGSAGDQYFVDAEGRLFLKLLDAENTYPFDHAGAQVLRCGRRWNNIRYKVHAEFAGNGAISMSLPGPLDGSAPSPSPPTSAPPPPSPTYAPTSAPPSPPPTTAPPSPPPAGPGLCCYGGCGNGNCQGGWCGESRGNCEGNCNGEFCPAASLASTPLRSIKSH